MDFRFPRPILSCLIASCAIAASSSAAMAAEPAFLPGHTGGLAVSAAQTLDPRLQGGYKFNEGGWTYVHLEGTPEQVGFQHGY